MTIKEFLLARITEDEETAKGAEQAVRQGGKPLEGWEWDYFMLNEGVPPQDDAERHVIKWLPARVLAECAAKRKIIADRERIDRNASDTEWAMGYSDANYSALHALAAVYADHPDYQSEWSMS